MAAQTVAWVPLTVILAANPMAATIIVFIILLIPSFLVLLRPSTVLLSSFS